MRKLRCIKSHFSFECAQGDIVTFKKPKGKDEFWLQYSSGREEWFSRSIIVGQGSPYITKYFEYVSDINPFFAKRNLP
jgi:hypothetical protein